MSFITMNQINRSRKSTRGSNIGGSYGSSSVARRNENIVTSSQAYDNYYGKIPAQREKNVPVASSGFAYNTPSSIKESSLLPKIANTDKKEEDRPRVLYSREKNTRKERDEGLTPSLMAQSEIKRSGENSKAQLGDLSKQILKQLPEEKETTMRQSRVELQGRTIGLVGLNNIGNTCFMNSILQCMLNLPRFNDYFLNNSHTRELAPNARVATAYARLVHLMRSSSARAETPSDIKAAVAAKKTRFLGYGQQDAQEFLLALLELLSLELNRSRNPKYKELKADLTKHSLQEISDEWWAYNRERENSVVCDYFAGQVLSKVVCGSCGGESIAFDNTWDFSLTFSHNDGGDILRMMENFLKEETISQDYYCGKCKAFRECTRKLFLYRLPQVLVLQVKRFSFGKIAKQKINNRIKVPQALSLARLITHSHHPSVKSPAYELTGVVNHSGDLNFGHYTADCRNPLNGKWYTFNDSSVSEMHMGELLESSYPYLLFYNKK